eukprot:CAMPEP_0197606334 /NCGR_PEP_ID=MMETSP1326-20131121/44864_1 /TAXON_ID=1155430 /ORGANISM="Genus nov. species nov., Strain RCC2288" /LENGTH=72 /DNA_ID=CAMNT_0043174233 /DNA_START=36 /DNA_END=254 /DNA_ORIENTATION=+
MNSRYVHIDASLLPYSGVMTGTNMAQLITASLISGAQSPPPLSMDSPTNAVYPAAASRSLSASVKSLDSAMR